MKRDEKPNSHPHSQLLELKEEQSPADETRIPPILLKTAGYLVASG